MRPLIPVIYLPRMLLSPAHTHTHTHTHIDIKMLWPLSQTPTPPTNTLRQQSKSPLKEYEDTKPKF